MEHTPPPRFGDWSAVNRHLTAGGTVEGIPWDNPYLPYIKQLMSTKVSKVILEDEKGWRKEIEVDGHPAVIHWADGLFAIDFELDEVEKDGTPVFRMISNDNLCDKPHNNGEDTCLECEVIKTAPPE